MRSFYLKNVDGSGFTAPKIEAERETGTKPEFKIRVSNGKYLFEHHFHELHLRLKWLLKT